MEQIKRLARNSKALSGSPSVTDVECSDAWFAGRPTSAWGQHSHDRVHQLQALAVAQEATSGKEAAELEVKRLREELQGIREEHARGLSEVVKVMLALHHHPEPSSPTPSMLAHIVGEFSAATDDGGSAIEQVDFLAMASSDFD